MYRVKNLKCDYFTQTSGWRFWRQLENYTDRRKNLYRSVNNSYHDRDSRNVSNSIIMPDVELHTSKINPRYIHISERRKLCLLNSKYCVLYVITQLENRSADQELAETYYNPRKIKEEINSFLLILTLLPLLILPSNV